MQEPTSGEFFENLRDTTIELILRKSQFIEAIENEARNHLIASRLVHEFIGKILAVSATFNQEHQEDMAMGKYD